MTQEELPLKQLATGKSYAELIVMMAALMHLGYDYDHDNKEYVTDDGYFCQPMILREYDQDKETRSES